MATLIHHIDFVGVDAIVLHDVALGALAHCDNSRSLTASSAELVIVDSHIDAIAVELRERDENQVVDCHHRRHTAVVDAKWQFIAQTMIQADSLALELADNAL